MEIAEEEVEQTLCCNTCQAPLSGSERFCGNCGNEVKAEVAKSTPTPDAIAPAAWYYFATLILLASYKFTSAFPEGFTGSVLISVIDAVIVIGFWIHFRQSIASVFQLRGIRVGVILAIICCALGAAVVVSFAAEFISFAVLDDVYYSPYLYEDTTNPFLWTVIFTCVFPAVVEEVAFRGFLFENIRTLTSDKGALYVTSFLFGILHLSVLSLFWLIPLGLAFGWLRLRYNTLWYGIIAHFSYNFFVSILEYASFPSV